MPRQDCKLRLDDRVKPALETVAKQQGKSFNALCESILFNYAKASGGLGLDAEPLPDLRGIKSGVKKKKAPGKAED